MLKEISQNASTIEMVEDELARWNFAESEKAYYRRILTSLSLRVSKEASLLERQRIKKIVQTIKLDKSWYMYSYDEAVDEFRMKLIQALEEGGNCRNE